MGGMRLLLLASAPRWEEGGEEGTVKVLVESPAFMVLCILEGRRSEECGLGTSRMRERGEEEGEKGETGRKTWARPPSGLNRHSSRSPGLGQPP
jgi:hypothetical protein